MGGRLDDEIAPNDEVRGAATGTPLATAEADLGRLLIGFLLTVTTDLDDAEEGAEVGPLGSRTQHVERPAEGRSSLNLNIGLLKPTDL